MLTHLVPLSLSPSLLPSLISCGEYIVYSGPLRALCPLAPNNVNTMACAAIAGHTVGFDGLQAELIADDSLQAHVSTLLIIPYSWPLPFALFMSRARLLTSLPPSLP